MVHWELWIVHLLLSVGMITGYIVYAGYGWQLVSGRYQAQWTARLSQNAIRLVLPLMNLVVVVLMMIAKVSHATSPRFFDNVAFVILVAALLDDHLKISDYLLRVLMLLGFFGQQLIIGHETALSIWLNVGALVVGLGLVRVFQPVMRRHYSLHLLLILGAWTIFWLPQSNIRAEALLRSLLTLLAMMTSIFFFWRDWERRHRDQQRLEKRATIDDLTQTFSFSQFREDLMVAADTVSTQSQLTMLAMVDIDYFKAVNDDFGHLAGDRMLQEVAAILKSQAASQSFPATVYRTGGEEFSLLMTVPHQDEATALVQDCWQRIRERRFQFQQSQLRLSISAGMTQLRPDDRAIDDAIKRSDDSLYLSKRRGRDTVTIDGQSLATVDHQTLMNVYDYYSQPVVELATGETKANELQIQLFDQQVGYWQQVLVFPTISEVLLEMAQATIDKLPGDVILSLSDEQFLNPQLADALIQFANAQYPKRLVIQLKQLGKTDAFKSQLRRYRSQHIWLLVMPWLDALTTPRRTMLRRALPEVNVVKFNLQKLRDQYPQRDDVIQFIHEWQQLTTEAGVRLMLSGIDSVNDEQFAKQLAINYVQGNFYAQPELPRL